MANQPLSELYKDLFDNTVQELLGMPNRAILADPACVSIATASGTAKSVDRVGRNPDQTINPTWTDLGVGGPMADRYNTKRFTRDIEDDPTEETIVNERRTHTPHNEVGLVRSWYEPEQLELGHEFDRIDQVEQQLSVRSETISQLRKDFFLLRNRKVIQALTAPTVARGRRVTATVAEPFPASQCVILPAPAGVATLDLATLTKIQEKFATNFVDEKILTLVNPVHRSQLIINSGDKIHNTWFVDSKEYFASGTLPDVYGHHIISLPQIAPGTIVSWVPRAVEFGVWEDMFMRLAENPQRKYNLTLYMDQIVGAVRADDRGVVHTITQAAFDERYPD